MNYQTKNKQNNEKNNIPIIKENSSCNLNTACMSLDKAGGIASTICAIHCLLTSIALGALSTVGLGFMESPLVDIAFISIAIIVGTFSLKHGYNHHRSMLPASLFTIGITLIVVSHFVIGHNHHHAHDGFHLELVDIMAIAGGLTLATFHFVNASLLKKSNNHTCCKNHKN